MGDKQVKMLTTVYPKEEYTGGLMLLNLRMCNDFTHNCQHMMKIVMASGSLRFVHPGQKLN